MFMNGTSQEIAESARRSFPFVMGDKFPNRPGVYFVKAMGYVKIGYTADFAQRYENFDRMLPERPEILAFVECARSVETTIHRLIKDHCLKNEWYLDCDVVRSIMADALAGRIKETAVRVWPGRVLAVPTEIKWASASLKQIAAPVERGEPIRLIIERTATRVGFSYVRTFEIWYGRARRLETSERDAISRALGVVNE